MSSACVFGITNVWPSAAGLISRNATARSDSATWYEGASSAAIEQKTQLIIIAALLIQVLGDLDRIESGARTEVVRAAEQHERVVAPRNLSDPAHERNIAAGRIDRGGEDVLGRIVPDRHAGRGPKDAPRLIGRDRPRELREDRDGVPDEHRNADRGRDHRHVGRGQDLPWL